MKDRNYIEFWSVTLPALEMTFKGLFYFKSGGHFFFQQRGKIYAALPVGIIVNISVKSF